MQDAEKKSDAQYLLTQIKKAIAIVSDPRIVQNDVDYLQHLYLSLPPVLVKDLFNFSLYFGLEDRFIYLNAPCWNPAYIHMWPENYFSVLLENPLELNMLPPQEWQWQKDSQEPWKLVDTWNT